MKGSYNDNNTMDVSLKLHLLNIKEDENRMARQENGDEEFFDCVSVTSNDDVTTEHLNDTIEHEQCNNIVHTVIKSNKPIRNRKGSAAMPKKCKNRNLLRDSVIKSRTESDKMNFIPFITSESGETSNESSIDSNSNKGRRYENVFDSSPVSSVSCGENATMVDNHYRVKNISSPVIHQPQEPFNTNIDISSSLRRVKSRESFDNISTSKKGKTGKYGSSNKSTNTLSRASSASSLSTIVSSSVLSLSSLNNHRNNHNNNVEFTSQKSQPHNHHPRRKVNNNESQPVYTAPAVTRNNINKRVLTNNTNPFLLANDTSLLPSNNKYNFNYSMDSGNEIFPVPEFHHQHNIINIEPPPLRSPPILKKSSFSKRVSFSNSTTQAMYPTMSMPSSSPPNYRYINNNNGDNKNAVFNLPKPQNLNSTYEELDDQERLEFFNLSNDTNSGKDIEDMNLNEKKSKKNMKEKTKAMGKKVKSLPNLVFSKAFQRNKYQKRIKNL